MEIRRGEALTVLPGHIREDHGRFGFVTPFVMDPSNSERLWLGGEYLFRTNNAAAQWTKASTQLPAGGLMSAIAVAPSDSNLVLAGTNKGHVLISRRALEATAETQWSASQPRSGWVTLDQLERDYILRALAAHQQDQGKTADLLGIHRKTLQRKLRKYGLADAGAMEEVSTADEPAVEQEEPI